jgi:predicted transposase YdaD
VRIAFCLTHYDIFLRTSNGIKKPVAKAADTGGKRLISLAPDAWVQWVTQRPEVVAKEILGSEFQWISRETDVLVKAYSATHGDFLVLNELQLR